MKLGGHQTFHLRESWLHKGISSVIEDENIFNDSLAPSRLGVGKNMMEAIRYWLQACQLVERRSGFQLSSIGKIINECDPYIELDGSILTLHYFLSTNEEFATAWYWFFNKFGATEFDTEALQVYLTSYLNNNYKKNISPNVIRREIQCLVKMYTETEYGVRETPETQNPSPFSRFAPVQKMGGKYRKVGFDVNKIDPLIYVYCLYQFWNYTDRPATISFENLCHQERSPGVVFGLSSDDNIQILDSIKDSYPSLIETSRSGGYFSVTVKEKPCSKALDSYYRKFSDFLQV